ncbi:hypothetical protein U7230_07800 [Carboxydochorda subterranea]|uniref:Type II toxin-antitoxin system RelE/ParE family toxin n=1 Tax=Carboxydichorda subterranea TaxID=3109565 RepID=A0ABZ1BT56_9FIRM|nr:hypothetical protein [Limnochorda sp. L945t]WRP16015.1 hypothetical protein U7230_07800 [Limnochorda sp. L945t]
MPRRRDEGRTPSQAPAPEPSPPAPYQVRLSSTAVKELKELGPLEARAVQALRRLMDDPMAGHPLTGELKGLLRLPSLAFSLPGGASRAVYAVKPKGRVCLVVIVGPLTRASPRGQPGGWRRCGGARTAPGSAAASQGPCYSPGCSDQAA